MLAHLKKSNLAEDGFPKYDKSGVRNVGRYPRIGGGPLPSFSVRLPASRREEAGGETLCRRLLDAEKKSARGGFFSKVRRPCRDVQVYLQGKTLASAVSGSLMRFGLFLVEELR